MPARIDPQERRQEVIRAAFRLVVAEGIEGVSLRKVADESGLNVGSVRHYFDGHHDLLTAAAEEAGARMGRRLASHPAEGLRGLTGEAALDALQALVEAVMPVDEPRRDEAIVVVELIMASRTMPVFRATSERMAVDLAAVLREALDFLDVPDVDLAAAQLAAVIGGLTLDTVTPHGALSVERMRAVLRAHLRMLLANACPG
ncbi:TetR/AcrR family transcriptional regulator [Streptomonospora nanhaiensis]|uniref:AcrR family transcriptional regulator n=1 Tax=Streptomonospora nanhaiensis TaxID=1323731 RepID=A0A853BXM8_9ACTN|nr:TetR family transcriptional regulator C-terminal domain-containing protein [Streptomonospora nanhaiensis]MBV2364679.1 TetR family transcriptional regulator C-terminal domain-containing protein [Streptomonospora nanhaiensis]MBX9389542.1 TetR family transcriptional regulator C-terminal domain-containing protein [Streptomonospora nanhaiensis]NYI99241.1 AcrR family transcriptional regulator [Streptomonospora nanhaiensis]